MDDDEAMIYKEIDADTVDQLFKERFVYNNQVPTYKGLRDIVNGKDTEAAMQQRPYYTTNYMT